MEFAHVKNGLDLKLLFEFKSSLCLTILCLLTSNIYAVNSTFSLLDANLNYEIGVKVGDWVEYRVTKVIEKAIIPFSFESDFPKNWTSIREGDVILVVVVNKTIVDFGNYTREFAIFNITFNNQPLIPFWFYDVIQSVQQLPLDGFSFFLPVNESFWDCLKDMVKFWATEASMHGIQVTFDVRKCFYRLRVDSLFLGWIEISANFDDYVGVLKDFSLRFLFSQDFINEVRQRLGTIIVDGEPFEIQPNKQYGVEFSLNDSNIAQLVNSVNFGQDFASMLDQAIHEGAVGAIITVRSQNAIRVEVLIERLNLSAHVNSERIFVYLNSTLVEGKTVIVNVWKEFFPVQWADEFQVFLDGRAISRANNYGDALNPFNEEEAEYFVVVGSKITQIAISIPHFSHHAIEIVKVPSFTLQLIVYSTITVIVCLVAIGVYIIRRRTKYYAKR